MVWFAGITTGAVNEGCVVVAGGGLVAGVGRGGADLHGDVDAAWPAHGQREGRVVALGDRGPRGDRHYRRVVVVVDDDLGSGCARVDGGIGGAEQMDGEALVDLVDVVVDDGDVDGGGGVPGWDGDPRAGRGRGEVCPDPGGINTVRDRVPVPR